MKALRLKTSLPAPQSFSPAETPVRPGTGSAVPLYTAENSRIGAEALLVDRVSVIARPPYSISILPDMGLPDQGRYLSLSGRKPLFTRSEESTP